MQDTNRQSIRKNGGIELAGDLLAGSIIQFATGVAAREEDNSDFNGSKRTLKSIALIQLGDVHYPWYQDDVDIDLKDNAFPQRIVQMSATTALSASLRAAAHEHQSRGAILMIAGDLTNYGNVEAYAECVKKLRATFRLDGTDRVGADTWHVATGNHDIDRTKVDPTGTRTVEPYQAAIDAWAPHVPLPVTEARVVKLDPGGDHGAIVVTLDSCVGSGEQRKLPEDVRNSIIGALPKHHKKKKDVNTALESAFETLDTPAFNESHLDQTLSAIRQAPSSHLPIVLAHHPLLPQQTPRVELYTELLNGGDARSRLSSVVRPVLYLHGHTHCEGVEIVVQRRPEQGKIVLVSAGLLAEGFNLITVEYSEYGRLLGLVIEPWVVAKGGDVKARTSDITRISLVDTRRSEHPLLRTILQSLPDDEKPLRMSDLKKIITQSGASYTGRELEDAVREAEWIGRVEIVDRECEPDYWTLRSERL